MQQPDSPEKLAEALERLEQERERRVAAKVEAGQAVVVPLLVATSQDPAVRKAAKLAELRAAGEKREVIFDTTVVDTGVPRAARDDRPAAPKASEAPPFPHRYEAPEPKPPPSRPAVSRVPDMTEPKNIMTSIPPRSEA